MWRASEVDHFIHQSISGIERGQIGELVYFCCVSDYTKSPIRVSFIIPCLNEELSLPSVIQEIQSSYSGSNFDYEIVVADNGSTDHSPQIAIALGARVVHVPEKGYGSALIAGINSASGEFGVMGDADGSYTFGDALPMIELLAKGYDLVIGNRFDGGIAQGAMPPLHKYLGNPILSFLGKLFFRIPVNDFHCGLRAFNRKNIVELNLDSKGMEFASEMIVSASRAKLRIAEVPVTLKKDLRNRPPHLKTWSDGWRHLKYLLSQTPGWVFLAPALVLFIGALTMLSLSIVGPIERAGIGISYRTSIIVGSLATLSTSFSWAFVLGREIIGNGFQKYPKKFLEGSIACSALLIIWGFSLFVTQFLEWRTSGFSTQPLGRPLIQLISGAALVSIGGISLSSTLILGLVRKNKQ